MKRLCDSDGDRISHLPDDEVQRILALLPLKEAAKTARLSKQWRHNWRANTRFVFDRHFGRISEKGNYASNANELMMKIYKVLLLHDGPITKFVLDIPGLRRPSVDIDHMVHILSKKGIQELALLFIFDEITDRDPRIEREMPSALFSAVQLSSLKLWECDILIRVPSWFQGFSKLTHLELIGVHVSSSFYSEFLSNCPLLHYLELMVHESAATESHLKAEIAAPSLKVLHTNVWNICFKHTPLLSELRIVALDEYLEVSDFYLYNPDIVAVFASLPAIRELTVRPEFIQFLASGDVPFRLPSHLHQLKVLHLHRITLQRLSEARVLFCLIMSSPNLQKLAIGLNGAPSIPPTEVINSLQLLLEAEDHSTASCFQCLAELSLSGVLAMQVELDLLRFVLVTAPLLRRVFIMPAVDLEFSKGHKFLKEAIRYKRASKEAEIIYA